MKHQDLQKANLIIILIILQPMKSKCTIRIVPREATNEEGNRGQVLASSNSFRHEKVDPIAEAHTDRDAQFQKLVSMFQTFIQSSETRQTHAPKPYQVEARDREVLIPLPEIVNNKITPEALKTWVTSVVKTVCSSAFNSFFKNEMNEEQTKIYCSENIFKNLVVLGTKYTLNAAEMELIDSHIQKGVLKYQLAKYPLTDSTEINKKLQAEIREVDNSEALPNNYFTNSNIVFEYRGSGNYNDLIMLMLNDLMRIVDLQNQKGVSSFRQFEEDMSKVFEMVEDEEWMRRDDNESVTHQLKLPHQLSEVASPSHSEGDHAQREKMAEMKERTRRQTEEKERYKNKVKEYTHYLIGRKIPESTLPYSQSQIQSGNISIKSPTILRILTKWCEELQQKYYNSYFSNRSESVKMQHGGNVNTLFPWMKQQIDFKLEDEHQLINKAMSDLFKNNYEMQSNILQHEMNVNGDEFIDQIEKISGKLSVKVVKNLHIYIIDYLNRLIHGLLKASKQLYDEANLFDYSSWQSPPNLLSFRIGDLMRCKFSSMQREVLKIYKELQRISKETPQKLKIIRVKNRLRSGTNDILINVRFKEQITCEIQLGIKSKASDFIECSNAFNHYLYELKRSIFGPLTELCSIWNSLDRRTDIYHDLVQEEQSAAPSQPQQHSCGKLKEKCEMRPFYKPFLCSLCNRTYHHSNYIRQHVKCSLCGYKLCAYCQIDGESEEELKNRIIASPELRQICKGRVRKDQNLPQFGLCVFIQSKETVEELFTLVTYHKNQYLLGKKNGEIIEVFKINSTKMMKKIPKKFVIFEVESNGKYQRIGKNEAIKNYILPQMMRENYKKQKQSINLMDLKLKTEQCQKILSVGSKSQKKTVKNLFLNHNKVEQLPFDPLEFPNIQSLTFSQNFMKSFEGIQHLQNLKNCICNSCQLSEIPPQFYDSPSLQQLNLSINKIARIDDSISKMKRILTLELSDNKLTELPEGLFECNTLTVLKMDNNQLTAIPDSIGKLSKLEVIDFYNNKLTQVTAAVGQLTHLRQIYLSKNDSLSILPESLSNLQKVEVIDVSQTQISSIPSPPEGWPNIRLISIDKSQISTLPSILFSGQKLEFLLMNGLKKFIFPQEGNYKSLKVLERSSAKAVDLPSCMGKMINLTKLYYKYNNLGSITSLPVLPNLQILDFSSCKLATLPRLTGFKKLKKMDLSQNSTLVLSAEGMELPSLEQFICYSSNLTQLSPCMLKWERLTQLYIRGNKITSFFDEETEARVLAQGLGWPNLKLADLSQNQLQAFPQAILNSLRIETIYLSKNKLKQIPTNIKHLTQLKLIIVDQNQVEVLPPEFGELLYLAMASLCQNKFTVVPMFIKDMPMLKIFVMDRNEIKMVECEEWVLRVEGIQLGGLKEIAQGLKDQRESRAAPTPNKQKIEATKDFNANEGQYKP